MNVGFWLNYFGALLVVALLLVGLYAVVRGLAKGRVLSSADRRLITVLESTALTQHSAVHVIKAGHRYYLLGANQGAVSTLGELPAEEVEAWLVEQKTLLAAQRASMLDAFKFLRGKS